VTQVLPLLIPAILMFLVSAAWRFRRAVQPLRLEMVDKGERLLAENGLSKTARSQVKMLLDSAFGARLMLLFSLIAFPIVALVVLIWPRLLADADKELAISDPAMKAEFDALHRLHFRIMLGNHPALASLLCLEMAILMPALYLGQMIVRGRAFPEASVDAFTVIVQRQKQGLQFGRWRPA
jgi:hypothetical protein